MIIQQDSEFKNLEELLGKPGAPKISGSERLWLAERFWAMVEGAVSVYDRLLGHPNSASVQVQRSIPSETSIDKEFWDKYALEEFQSHTRQMSRDEQIRVARKIVTKLEKQPEPELESGFHLNPPWINPGEVPTCSKIPFIGTIYHNLRERRLFRPTDPSQFPLILAQATKDLEALSAIPARNLSFQDTSLDLEEELCINLLKIQLHHDIVAYRESGLNSFESRIGSIDVNRGELPSLLYKSQSSINDLKQRGLEPYIHLLGKPSAPYTSLSDIVKTGLKMAYGALIGGVIAYYLEPSSPLRNNSNLMAFVGCGAAMGAGYTKDSNSTVLNCAILGVFLNALIADQAHLPGGAFALAMNGGVFGAVIGTLLNTFGGNRSSKIKPPLARTWDNYDSFAAFKPTGGPIPYYHYGQINYFLSPRHSWTRGICFPKNFLQGDNR